MNGPEPGAKLLDEVHDFLSRFVAFPSPAALHAAALWAGHAHLAQHFHLTPRLALLSPEPGSGKTRALEVLETLVPRPMFSFSASPAAIFRTLALEPRTLLFDEVDTVFTRKGKDDGNEDLRALLNMGYRRGASIPRCVGPRHEVQHFAVFAPAALAGLGDLPDTIMTRSIIIRMRRRAPGEHIEQFRSRMHEPQGAVLRDRLAVWAEGVGPDVGEAWPEMPDGVVDREAEVWEPLLAIADVAAGHWPQTARSACLELLKVASNREVSLGVRLLGDLRDVFGASDAMSTADILEALNGLDEAPWGDLYGKPLEARTLARMVKRYGVTSTKVKVDGRALQGYRREDLWDSWQRYLAPVTAEAEPTEPPLGSAPSRVPDEARPVPHTRTHSTQVPLAPEPKVPPVPEPPHEAEPQTRVPDDVRPQVPQVPATRDEERPLEWRAAQLAAELRPAGIDAWRNRYGEALAHATLAPTFWADTARAEPLAVTIAVELLAHDEVADTICAPVPSYLVAARAAVGDRP